MRSPRVGAGAALFASGAMVAILIAVIAATIAVVADGCGP